VALAATLGLAVDAAAAGLSGKSVLRVGDLVSYGATGLVRADGYALRIYAYRQAGRKTLRCVAYLAAPRRASGAALFRGSVPRSLNCVVGTGSRQIQLRPGPYTVQVCVPSTVFGPCKSRASIVQKKVRVIKR
jgi:hypothetical protein